MKYYREFASNSSFFDGKSVLITGGTGSFGSRMLKTLLNETNVKRVVVYSRDELKQYELHQSLSGIPDGVERTRFFIGDVRDRSRLETALFGIDFVIHAAALKQVTTAEYNPFECIHTNIIGAENVIQASMITGVKRVIALSTDKAANPINLYGATKLASDKLFVAANNMGRPRGCIFSVVRYGNVIGSRGSVIPFFNKLLEQGTDHLPITDERMTRFWITLRQGVSFVMSNLETMCGGEIFIPKIPSMSMPDLATALAPKLEQRIIGMRPGEKLHEVMVPVDDAPNTVELDDRFVILPHVSPYSPVGQFGGLRENSKQCPPEFQYSSDTNSEWLQPKDLKEWLAV